MSIHTLPWSRSARAAMIASHSRQASCSPRRVRVTNGANAIAGRNWWHIVHSFTYIASTCFCEIRETSVAEIEA